MKLVATMLVGPGTEQLITRAALSVRDLVDGYAVIDTRPDGQRTAHALEGHFAGLPEPWVVPWKWTGDYAEARNAALRWAKQMRADFALTLDTDETVHADPVAARATLEAHPGVDVFVMPDEGRTYRKERIIRCSSGGRYVQPVHETFARDRARPGSALLPGFFREDEKTSAQLVVKFERDIVALHRWIEDDRNRTTRALRYLGESHLGMAHHASTLSAQDRVSHLCKASEWFHRASTVESGFSEERAWCAYRHAETLVALEQFEQAVPAAAFVLTLDPGYAREAAAVAAHASSRMELHEQALRWAHVSIACEPPENRVLPRALGADKRAAEVAQRALGALGRSTCVTERDS